MQKIVTPKTLAGFINMLPREQIVFNEYKNKIEQSYKSFGFIPLETPVLEYSSILLAKAGGETEKQIYRFTKGDNDLCMRFDLTVPLANYVAKNCNELTFPFKRYQIERSYRGERVQKGRFREFYQCDADIVAENELSVSADAECIFMIYTTLNRIDIKNFVIKINNRKILNGYCEFLAIENKEEVLRILDKIDKIGKEEVISLLAEIGLAIKTAEEIVSFILYDGDVSSVINYLRSLKIENGTFIEGVGELEEVCNQLGYYNLKKENYKISLSTVRGLDYYTGTVFETVLVNYPQFGSICGGGRYENLASNYTNRKFVGVGFSIGLSRLFSQLTENNLIDLSKNSTAKCIVLSMGQTTEHCIKTCNYLRENEINTEFYLQEKSLKNKLNYANKMGIQYAIIIGEDEVKTNTVCLKDMQSGKQENISMESILQYIK